jgi:hypothetical protein
VHVELTCKNILQQSQAHPMKNPQEPGGVNLHMLKQSYIKNNYQQIELCVLVNKLD